MCEITILLILKIFISDYFSSSSSPSSSPYTYTLYGRQQFSDPLKRKHTNGETIGNNVCPNCGKVYKYLRGLQQHLRYECGKEPMFKCPYCPRKCNQPVNLKSHLKRCKYFPDNSAFAQ